MLDAHDPRKAAPSRTRAAEPLRHIIVTLSALWLLASAAGAQTVVRTVGSGAGCDFGHPEDAIEAIASLPATERIVRLERGVFENVSVHVTVDQLTLRGGFESCGAALPTPGAETILSGDGALPVLRLSTLVLLADPVSPDEEGVPTFVLDHLELQGGHGGLRVTGPADVRIADSLILGNEALVGGGIFVDGSLGAVHLDLVRTGVNGNRTLPDADSPDGGGIHCRGDAVIRAFSGTTFVGNATADLGRGGGLYLDDCDFEAHGDVKIQLNKAHQGGGIAAAGNSLVTLRGGSGTGLPLIALNRAEPRSGPGGRGGGLHLQGFATLDALGARIEDNRALPETGADGGEGGGLFVSSRATLDGPAALCARCATLDGNRAARGAAAVVTRTGHLTLRRSHVDGNLGDLSILEVSSGSVAASGLVVEHSFLTRNLATQLIDLVDQFSLELTHASAAGNLELDRLVRGTGTGSVAIASSVLFEPGVPLLSVDDTVDVTASCAIVGDDGTLPEAPDVVEADPLFVDAEGGDLHLEPTSPAVDLCGAVDGASRDIDGQATPVDQTVVPDDGTPADAGADEVGFVEPPEPLFSDGFERGDLTAWTAATG